MFQFAVDFLKKVLSPIIPFGWGGQAKRSRDDIIDLDEEEEEEDPPTKKFRMNPKDSSYFPNPYFKRQREKCSQTTEVINLDPTPLVETISLLDDTSSVSDKENTSAPKASPFKNKSPHKNKFRPPSHCRSPLKSKFKYVTSRRGSDDVQYVGTISKDSPDTTDLLSSDSSRRPLMRRITPSQRKQFRPRTEHIMSHATMRSSNLFRNPDVFDFQGRMIYEKLLGQVLKSPEAFSCSVLPRKDASTSKVIDLTVVEPSTSKSASKSKSGSSVSNIPSAVVDLTASGPSRQRSPADELINLESDNSSVGKCLPHRRLVSPVNSLSTNLKHIPCTSTDYVSNLVSELEDYKKKFAKDQQQLSKLSAMSPLRKTFEQALEERLKRHLRITTIDLEEEEEEPTKPELTEDMISAVINAWDPRKPKGQVLANNFNYQISRSDLQSLSGVNWLNDEVINFYMELITARGKEKDFPSVHTFNTFFYPKLEKDGHSSLRRWTRKVDIFSFDLIIVPIHLRVHWCLAIIDFKKKTITYFDSMGQANKTCVNSLLRYLEDEHVDKKKEPYDTSSWKLICTEDTVPQQMNSCDCGVFACTFAEYATREAKYNFSQDDMPYFRRKMTYEILNSALLPWN